MEGNIQWPRKKHWLTKILIDQEPVLKANKLTEALAQEVIISNELTFLTKVETDKENVKVWYDYQKYKNQLELAIRSMQIRASD
jgi:hypothetical protein